MNTLRATDMKEYWFFLSIEQAYYGRVYNKRQCVAQLIDGGVEEERAKCIVKTW